MKNIFIALITAVIFNACTTQPTPIAISIDKTTFTQSNSNGSTETLTSIVTNTTSTSGSISWDFSEVTAVSGWTYSIRINNTVQTGTSGSFDLEGSATATIAVTINPNNVTGVCQATLTLKNNEAVLNTLTYNHTATNSAPTPKFTISTISESGSSPASRDQTDYYTYLTNVSNTDLNIKWIMIPNTQNPSGWANATCDIVQCYDPMITSSVFTLQKDSTASMKTIFYPDNITGSGDVTTHIFVETDSLATVKTFLATHTAN